MRTWSDMTPVVPGLPPVYAVVWHSRALLIGVAGAALLLTILSINLVGDQLREDLRGVGKAASGAMVERQMDALADRLQRGRAQRRPRDGGAIVRRALSV